MTGITTIFLGGQQRTLSFKNNFILLLGINLNIDPIDVAQKIGEYCAKGQVMRALSVIAYCGICANYERQYNYEHGITIEQVAEWCDEADQKEFESVWRAFAEIMDIPQASEKQIAEYEKRLKKKVISPKQNPAKSKHGKASLNTQ